MSGATNRWRALISSPTSVPLFCSTIVDGKIVQMLFSAYCPNIVIVKLEEYELAGVLISFDRRF